MAYQLRVRISGAQKARLEELARAAGWGENTSDIVRHAIDRLGSSNPNWKLSDEANQLLNTWEKDLQRPLAQIIEECIHAVNDMLQGEPSPLIVEEIKLRRSYSKSAKKREHRSPSSIELS